MTLKNVILSTVLIGGGSVALYALTHNENPTPNNTPQNNTKVQTNTSNQSTPLTTDMAVEERMIAQKQKERERQTQLQEEQARALLESQERAEQYATHKAQKERTSHNQSVDTAIENTATNLKVQTRPEAVAIQREQAKLAQEKTAQAAQTKASQSKHTDTTSPANKPLDKKTTKEPVVTTKTNTEIKNNKTTEKNSKTETVKHNKGQHTIERGDTLIKLSHQYGVPVSILAKANNMGRNDALPAGKTIKIPSKSEVARLQQDSAKQDKKENSKKELAKDTPKKDTKEKTGVRSVPTHYSVQVALADNQEKANALAKQYRAAGYKVVTSRTSKGVRVLVGSESSAAAANTLKTKISKDSRVKTDGAWVKQVDTINP